MYNFPATNFPETIRLFGSAAMSLQWQKMVGGVIGTNTALHSYRYENGDLFDVAIKTIDVIHACETMLRMLEANGVNVEEAVGAVYAKNLGRGYYGVG